MDEPTERAGRLRAEVHEHLLGGYFDIRLVGDHGNKPGDGDYVPRAVETNDDEVTIHCLGDVRISIVTPRDVRVDHSGMRVFDAARVTLAARGDVVFAARVDGDEVIAEVTSSLHARRVQIPRLPVSEALLQLVRVDFA